MARTRTLASVPLIGRTHAPWGAAANLALRLAILLMTVDVLVHGSDPRFAGKGLQPRDVLISFGFAMLFPLFWKLRYARRQWHEYPWWFDDLYLSIFALDMVGNELGLYSTAWWSNIPHGYGPAALTIVLTGAFGLTLLEAAAVPGETRAADAVAHATATGKVLLAFGERPLPPGTLKTYTSKTITNRAALLAELEDVRKGGYALNFGEREDDLHAVAAPVWGSRGELAAIIGVQGPASRFDDAAMQAAVQPLLEQTAQVSLELGWKGPVTEVERR